MTSISFLWLQQFIHPPKAWLPTRNHELLSTLSVSISLMDKMISNCLCCFQFLVYFPLGEFFVCLFSLQSAQLGWILDGLSFQFRFKFFNVLIDYIYFVWSLLFLSHCALFTFGIFIFFTFCVYLKKVKRAEGFVYFFFIERVMPFFNRNRQCFFIAFFHF